MTCESGYVNGKYVNTTDVDTPIDAQSYNLDITGITDTSLNFKK